MNSYKRVSPPLKKSSLLLKLVRYVTALNSRISERSRTWGDWWGQINKFQFHLLFRMFRKSLELPNVNPAPKISDSLSIKSWTLDLMFYFWSVLFIWILKRKSIYLFGHKSVVSLKNKFIVSNHQFLRTIYGFWGPYWVD